MKMSLIQEYNNIVNFDLIAHSETYLTKSVGNEAIHLEGFSTDIFMVTILAVRGNHVHEAKN